MPDERVYPVSIARPAGDTRTAEDWARATWEGAPLPMRVFMLTGWRTLGFALGPRPSAGHVLGWKIVSATPGEIVLEVPRNRIEARNVVELSETAVRWTTSVRPLTTLGRVLWRLAEPLHLWMLPTALKLAAKQRPH